MNDFQTTTNAIEQFVDNVPLQLQRIPRQLLEGMATEAKATMLRCHCYTVEQACVDFLCHSASDYDAILRKLNSPDELGLTGGQRHILHVERRRCVARIKKRILDEISSAYPWLSTECERQKQREGVDDGPGDFVIRFQPFKGKRLRDLDTDYLLRLLGQTFVRKSLRTRIERHLAERQSFAATGEP